LPRIHVDPPSNLRSNFGYDNDVAMMFTRRIGAEDLQSSGLRVIFPWAG
jgi:hypothetical protein